MAEIAFLNHLSESDDFPSIQLLKISLGRLGFDNDLLTAYNAFQDALHQEILRRAKRLDPNLNPFQRACAIADITEKVKATFPAYKDFRKIVLSSSNSGARDKSLWGSTTGSCKFEINR